MQYANWYACQLGLLFDAVSTYSLCTPSNAFASGHCNKCHVLAGASFSMQPFSHASDKSSWSRRVPVPMVSEVDRIAMMSYMRRACSIVSIYEHGNMISSSEPIAAGKSAFQDLTTSCSEPDSLQRRSTTAERHAPQETPDSDGTQSQSRLQFVQHLSAIIALVRQRVAYLLHILCRLLS